MSPKTAFAAILTLSASTALAASIVNSKHDLAASSAAGVRNTQTTQICVFCHTPHNPARPAPLWNRLPPDRDPGTYVLYRESETLSLAARAARMTSASASMLCLSCHDGTLAEIGSRIRYAPVGGTLPLPMIDTYGSWGTSGVLWDGACVANHPVGFDYASAQAERPARLRTVAEVTAAFGTGVFYAGPNGSTSMECNTCHATHDPAYPPFLRKSNANNALCLACHVR
jgi:predicted CXXCH cytochrome family protein